MGFFDFLKKQPPLEDMIANNVIEQYRKCLAKGLPQDDIPQILFIARYSRATLDNDDTFRLGCYYESEFPFETVADFVLATMDIELNLSPGSNSGAFQEGASCVIYKIESKSIPCTTEDYNNFVYKWRKLISPQR